MISGVVALTLSPVMSAKFLRAGDAEHGFGRVDQSRFDRLRDWYGRMLDATLRARPAVYTVWIGLTFWPILLFIHVSPKELAPTEDQGVIFGIVDAPANSTIEQTRFVMPTQPAKFS